MLINALFACSSVLALLVIAYRLLTSANPASRSVNLLLNLLVCTPMIIGWIKFLVTLDGLDSGSAAFMLLSIILAGTLYELRKCRTTDSRQSACDYDISVSYRR